MYYLASPANEALCGHHQWINDSLDAEWLEKGLLYLTAKNANARSEAMLKYEVVV
jgi:hypothetical protein